MPTAGKLTIETEQRRARRELRRRARRGTTSGAHAMLSVSDNGVGMDSRDARARSSSRSSRRRRSARHGPRPLDGLRHRQAERRQRLGLQRARQGHDVQGLPACRRRGLDRRTSSRRRRRSRATGTETILLVEDEDAVRDTRGRHPARSAATRFSPPDEPDEALRLVGADQTSRSTCCSPTSSCPR